MARRKGSLTAPPIEWVRLLSESPPNLHRVALLWRRGAVPYRPIDPDELDERDAADWADLELPDTDFEWTPDDPDNPIRDRESIEEIVEKLWDAAVCWTRARGEWCDVQLVGYDADGDVLFEDGRRCKLGDEDHPDPPEDRRHSGEHGDHQREFQAWRDIHRDHARSLERIIDYTRTDRDDAVRRSKATLDDTSRLWSQANTAVREAIEYQREQVQRSHDQNSGRIELKARAFAEMEKTRRASQGFELAKYGLDLVVAHGVPLANRLFEVLGNRSMSVFPEFKYAQQAMAYLVLTLTATQLGVLTNNNKPAGAALLAVFDQASKMDDEREALEHAAALVRILRSERFRDVAQPEQQLAGRFIIGRLALYRIAEFGEDDDVE